MMVAGCQIGGSTVSGREGYFTWVDEQGQVRYTPVAQSPEPPEKREGGPEKNGLEEEFSAENYPDAEDLRGRGYVREGDPKPYYTWRDAEGNLRATYYQPDTRTDEEKGLVPQPPEMTSASVYRAGDSPLTTEPVSGHDPDAFAILGIGQESPGYLERFSRTCCQTLESRDGETWQEDREFGVYITERSPTHDFLTGKSPYQLIALPGEPRRKGKVLRLRSYASNGVFVPSVLFLDGDFAPLRLVMDLVSDFEPENWHRRGYLEARIPLSPSRDERWILIFTRDDDLQGQTVVQTRRGPQKIPHVRIGEFGLILEDVL